MTAEEVFMRIQLFEEAYRDDLVFMVLQAKDALGRKPSINEDLLHIRESYFDRGDQFWIAVDENDRVAGCVGYHLTEGGCEAFLHRLYVRAADKRRGIGTALLETAEAALRRRGVSTVRVHLGAPKAQWFESYAFYPKHGYAEYAPRYMMKSL